MRSQLDKPHVERKLGCRSQETFNAGKAGVVSTPEHQSTKALEERSETLRQFNWDFTPLGLARHLTTRQPRNKRSSSLFILPVFQRI
jgi:hypothetical protein